MEVEEEGTAVATYPLLLPRSFGSVRLLPEGGRFTAADFVVFAAENRDLQLEMTKEGLMIIMMPAGNGAQLGWLIDPKKKKVHIYRPGESVEVLDNPAEVSGEPLLKGFTLRLAGIID